ncbi:MAG TPA: hypothetical protein VJ739_05435, partial [Gemmataceae bacterium]|nr:hypothetical protein [Gemmataceae bacterium]
WTVLTLAALLAPTAAARPAEPLDPGLRPGKDDVPGPFHPYNVVGGHEGKFHSPLSEHGLNPTVLVFVRGTEPSAAVVDLLKKLDALVGRYPDLRAGALAVFLSDDITDLLGEDDKREAEAKALHDKTGDFKHVEVSLDVPADVKDAFKLNDNAEVTVLYCNKLHVEIARAFAKGALDAKAVQALVDEIGAKLDKMQAALSGRRRKKS